MNLSKNSDTKRIGEALAVLRQKVENILEIAPNLMEINSLEEIPQKRRKNVEYRLWAIFAYGEYPIKEMMSNLNKPLVFVKNKGNYDYYIEKYSTLIKKITELIDVSKAPLPKEIYVCDKHGDERYLHNHIDIFLALALNGWLQNDIKTWCEIRNISIEDIMSLKAGVSIGTDNSPISQSPNTDGQYSEGDKIKKSFDTIIKAAQVYIEGLRDDYGDSDDDDIYRSWADGLESDFGALDKIINKPYFNPDDWGANEDELHPVFVEREISRIPTRIRERNCEIHHSFIFGNWMSVIALSRCLLEYAIIERKSLLNIEIHLGTDKKRIRKLYNLASDAKKVFPELAESMEHIIDAGNKVMHPSPLGKISKFPPGKEDAKHCVVGIAKIISTLYSK